MEEHTHEDHHFEEEPKKWRQGPIKAFIGLILLLMIVMWAFPHYSIKLNPEPLDIPSIQLIQSQFLDGVEIGNETGIASIRESGFLINKDKTLIKQAATKIAVESCTESKICHAKALYYFVRDNVKYVSDPYSKEYIASPVETLKTGGGDCDDGAVLLAALVEAVGIDTEIVLIPGHAFIRAYIPEAPKKYKIEGWVYLDWTCKSCRFGEIPYNNILQISD